MVLEFPWYLHECEIIKGALDYEFIITVARDEFPLVVSSPYLRLRLQFVQGRVTSLLSIGSMVDLGFVYLVCREDLNHFHVCFGIDPKGLSEVLL